MKTALVLGATGGIGGEVARTLVAHGWRVTALNRKPEQAPRIEGVTWVGGDAMVRADVVAAASGVDLIVHAVNPPGYRNWGQLVLPMMDNTIAAAQASGARVLLPGTIYNYGSDTQARLTENTPQRPTTRKGEIRRQMEERLRNAGVKALVVRAGDFFGPRAGNNWFSQGLVKPGQKVASVMYPGAPGVGHAWAYLPDLAETMAQLADREAQLGQFETFHFRGVWDADGTRMTGAIGARVRAFPWFVVRLLAPFKTLFREMAEMRYLWQQPFELDNARLVAFLGVEPHTSLDVAVRNTLTGLGCR
ncbi:MAG: NAD(P)H-binding protein [Pseudomonadota bacterium]